ncbi:hypothetical protein M408DRAFT_329337 [Serendipita vermifera MAFF 305830]|uniref:Uncharacterized protein n=1 Tax=Serendipita vermifera MAFF 305830 TaxID=933852 RepID=A0A0C3B8U6_SERVB|nr:hypothetical protein M408DRAFT_329337 [Serendipita vermifera MAFF 305830]
MAGEHTPKPRGNGKPLPDVVGSGAATVGRVEGHSAAAAAAAAALKDSRVRSGSAGDTSRVGATSPSPSVGQRRTGDLKIPARISMRQGSLKRELEAVKEFATSVEDLKRLQTNHQAVLAALAPNPRRSSSRASNQAVNPATIQSIEAQYGMWWECAELLVELGGAAPPTVAGTPIQENQPSIPPRTFGSQGSANGHYGTQRSFSSSSSGGDLSTRQLEILKQMLSTPNPTTFNPSSIRWPNGGSRQELSGSGSDHIVSSSARGTKSTLNSASSLHDQPPSSVSRAQANSSNYPYAQGTWTTKNRTSNPSGSRPNLNGVFPSSETQKPAKSSQTASRGTLSGSSAAGGIVTTDDTEEEISDWDRDSSSDSGKAARKLSSHASSLKPASSTASSSVDMSHHQIPTQARLALTPETILPLLSYAREVKSRLVDCLDELERARGRSRGTPSASTAVSAAAQQQQYSSSSRGSRAPEIGTSTLRRA